MAGYIKINVLNAMLLIPIFIIAFISPPLIGGALILIWLVFAICLNVMTRFQNQDVLARLESAPRSGYFEKEIEVLTKNYRAVEDWGSHARGYDADGSIRKSYDLIFSQMNNVLESAIKYITMYDYHTKPRPKYLHDLVQQSVNLVSKLHDLQDLILKVEDSTSDVDISYVDDMLEALREMNE